MPEIRSIESGSHEGKEGFVVDWAVTGLTREGSKFRAIVATAMRFPTTVTEVSVVDVRTFNSRDHDIRVFVPTEGFPSAGIEQPLKWMRRQFGDRFTG